jgi:hypothetical protein
MIDQLNDPIMSPQPLQELNLVGIALVGFVVCPIERNPFQSQYSPLGGTHYRVDFGRTAFTE